jgi:ketose-bisphosphate aldolase
MLVPLPDLLSHGLRNGFAVGYFEAWDSYSLEAVVEASEAERAPVILGFGCAVVDQDWMDWPGIVALGHLGQVMAERCSSPVSLLLNEARTLDQARAGIGAGFNAVMLDTSGWPFGEAVESVGGLVQIAHAAGVCVEGELGRLPDAIDGAIETGQARLTDPEEAARFVTETEVDCLAVSIGNVHLLFDREADVDVHRLAEIHRRISVPLVMHGGTGFPAAAVSDAIAFGVAKFNVGTVLKREFLAGVRDSVAGMEPTRNVHSVVGSHGSGDFMLAGKARMRDKVRALMRLYGSSGKAENHVH